MDEQALDPVPTYFMGVVASGATAQVVADALAAALRGIEEALRPVIGGRGVAALYKRALHLARQPDPWLPTAAEGLPSTMELGDLAATLAARPPAEACAASIRLLHAFLALLTGLIGESLTERLLRSVWVTFLADPSDRDDTSCPAK
jgi:hypothetical protein